MKQLCVWIGLALMSGCVMQPAATPGPAYGAPGAYAAPPSTHAYGGEPNGRRVTFNAVPLEDRGWQIVAQLDAHFGMPLPDGDYWYDPLSGACGAWGGPTWIILPPAMPLGASTMPANASGGGDGSLTNVFLNGREVHPYDVAMFEWLTGQPVRQGRWWADAAGNFGPEGWAAAGNFYTMARAHATGYQSSGGGRSWTAGGGAGSTSFWAGSDGNGYNWAMDGASGCSYASDGGGVIC